MAERRTDRHLSTRALLDHWTSGVPVLVPLAGDPLVHVLIDRPNQRLTLRLPLAESVDPPSNDLAHVRVAVALHDGMRKLEVSTTDERLLEDGYTMLCRVADRVQLDGLTPLAALEETLATWRSILAMRLRMSPEREIGLFGELLVIEALLASEPTGAVQAWRAAAAEEHDFGFATADLEVKTTTGERRQHWIHGLRQLVPTGSRPLWLLSVQITRSGAAPGRTLPQLVDAVIEMVASEEVTLLSSSLASVGWRDEQRDLFVERWHLRSRPLPLHIDAAFPRLTPDVLVAGSVDLAAIREVRYQIDVSGRAPSDGLPEVLSRALDLMESKHA